jgi:hypothetical protein
MNVFVQWMPESVLMGLLLAEMYITIANFSPAPLRKKNKIVDEVSRQTSSLEGAAFFMPFKTHCFSSRPVIDFVGNRTFQ